MTGKIRGGLANLCAASALGLVGAFLYAFDDDTARMLGGVGLFVALVAAVVGFTRLAVALQRGD